MNAAATSAAVAALAVLALASSRGEEGSTMRTPRGIDRDLGKLTPGFRRRVERVLARMQARGFDAVVWEAWRSPERAAKLAAKGTGIALSMHTLGIAVDIISRKNRWDAGPEFWQALGEEYEREGIVWGGRWRSGDNPHGQGVTVAQQGIARAATREQLEMMTA